ncbi:MAG: RluA family pseudouridine synthase [Prevotella sp.]|nr:RluA family pseudouridine synthase [Prevotella sp.]
MKMHPLYTDIPKPERFTYPFCYEPHPLCQLAAKEVQAYVGSHEEIREDADRGKMFGVLIVTPSTPLNPSAPYYFLAAYSGLLAGRNDWDYFVPPVFDAQQPDGYFKTKEREISCLSKESGDTKEMSQDLQLWLFHQYQLSNARGEENDLVAIWQSYYSREKLRRKFPLPPGGTGDCCAPKLLQYAYQQGLKPVCMAEFWWGQSTKEELRQHGNFYPACRGKCKPILTWMLQGLEVDPDPETFGFSRLEVKTVYEDQAIVVIDKPSGLLSVPGRMEQYSVETLMRERYPESHVAHRLDMWTSGLLIVAKSMEAYHALQQQFIKHQVKKRYLAMLEHSRVSGIPKKGTISLPLRPDPMNRPRQVVDDEHGKRAVTDYEFLSDDMVALEPQTGRTHQLRIHCAHPEGLGRPIKGDELYGMKANRLYLHAEQIWFHHPVTGEDMHFVAPLPF